MAEDKRYIGNNITRGAWRLHIYPTLDGEEGFAIHSHLEGGGIVSLGDAVPGKNCDRIARVTEANVTLMAAAPDLLRELQAAMSLLDTKGIIYVPGAEAVHKATHAHARAGWS